MSSLGNWIDEVVAHNRKQISVAATCIARTHRAGGLVFTAGSGHSLAMVMETFFAREDWPSFVRCSARTCCP